MSHRLKHKPIRITAVELRRSTVELKLLREQLLSALLQLEDEDGTPSYTIEQLEVEHTIDLWELFRSRTHTA